MTVVTYFNPKHSVIINSSITIINTAAIKICNKFIKD